MCFCNTADPETHFLCVCVCPQISECDALQIRGLSCLRSSLATLSIHCSTHTMTVPVGSPNLHRSRCVSCTSLVTVMLTTCSRRSWSQRQASSRSGNLRGRSLAVLWLQLSLCGKTWPHWTWVTTASAASTAQWWEAALGVQVLLILCPTKSLDFTCWVSFASDLLDACSLHSDLWVIYFLKTCSTRGAHTSHIVTSVNVESVTSDSRFLWMAA